MSGDSVSADSRCPTCLGRGIVEWFDIVSECEDPWHDSQPETQARDGKAGDDSMKTRESQQRSGAVKPSPSRQPSDPPTEIERLRREAHAALQALSHTLTQTQVTGQEFAERVQVVINSIDALADLAKRYREERDEVVRIGDVAISKADLAGAERDEAILRCEELRQMAARYGRERDWARRLYEDADDLVRNEHGIGLPLPPWKESR